MTDLIAEVKGLRPETPQSRDVMPMTAGYCDAIDAVLALIPEGAVLVTEEGLARALQRHSEETGVDHWDDAACAAAILRHLRETP